MRRLEFGLLCVLTAVAFTTHVDSSDDSALKTLPMDPEQAALQAEIDRTTERILAKDAVIGDLLAGRLTLRQAAARFQELDATLPEPRRAHWRETCPGNTDEERYCWTALRFVPSRCDSEQRRALRERIEAELPGHLRDLLDCHPFDEQ